MSKRSFIKVLEAATAQVKTSHVQMSLDFEGIRTTITPLVQADLADVEQRVCASMHNLYGPNKSIYLIGDITIRGVHIEQQDVIIETRRAVWPHTKENAPVWEASKERSIPVTEMDVVHIINALRWTKDHLRVLQRELVYAEQDGRKQARKDLQFRCNHYSNWLKKFKTELYRRHIREELN